MDFKKGAADGREEMKDDGFPSDHRPGADGGCLGDARDLMSDRANATAGTVLAVRPRVLQVEITSHCNLKCVMCPLTLGATLWEQVVKAAREVGRVNLTGFGENATNAKFPALLEELDALGIWTSFTTNAIGMRPTLVARIAGLTYIYHVYISIDSPDPEIYRTILGGSLKKALLGLQTLIDGLSDRVALTVSSVAMPDLLRSIGIRTYHLQGLHDRTSILADDDLRRNSAGLESVREIRRRCAELGIHLESSNEGTEVAAPATSEEPRFSAARTRQCLAPWDFPFVDREGRVFPGDSCRDGALASIG